MQEKTRIADKLQSHTLVVPADACESIPSSVPEPRSLIDKTPTARASPHRKGIASQPLGSGGKVDQKRVDWALAYCEFRGIQMPSLGSLSRS